MSTLSNQKARIGEPAPDFTLYSVEGEQVSLSTYRGRSVLLIFLRHTG